MFRLVALLAIIGCSFAGTVPLEQLPQLDGRIVGGSQTTIKDHPYQVSIQTKKGFHFCGGSIISEDLILTAAHCMQELKANEIMVRLGTTNKKEGGVLVAVKSFRSHENFNINTMVNDVALIKLDRKIKQTTDIRYIELADETPKTGTPAVVTGWGKKSQSSLFSPAILMEVEVTIVDRKQCRSKTYSYGTQVTNTMVCAYGLKKDSCQGDSGGPLVAGSKLVGVVSWGYGCAVEGYPGVYADVPVFLKWIKENAAEM